MSPELSFWNVISGPEQAAREVRWDEALSKKGKGYLAMVDVRGYPIFGYFIPNAEYPGKGNFFIATDPVVIAPKNSFVLDDEEIELITSLNIGPGKEAFFELLGATENRISGKFRVEEYNDNTTPEEGVKITNFVLGENAYKPEHKVSGAKSACGFAMDLEIQTGLKLEPVTLSELKGIRNQPRRFAF